MLTATALPNAKAISETARHRNEIEKMKRENMKLEGEIAILRSNMLVLERENYSLKTEKSKNLVSELNKLDQVKKEMKMLMTENRIKDNQLKAFKKTKTVGHSFEMDTRWALEMLDSDYQLTLYPFEYERLKKLHDLFYEDFKTMLAADTVIKEVRRIRGNFGEFIKCFLIFCCKKEVFDHFIVDLFCEYGFQDNSRHTKQMFKILKYAPIEWVSAFFTNGRFVQALCEFLEENAENTDTVLFYMRVAENRPFLLSFVLGNKLFMSILRRKDEYSQALIRLMAEKGLSSFIDYQNINLVTRESLKVFFKREYVEIDQI